MPLLGGKRFEDWLSVLVVNNEKVEIIRQRFQSFGVESVGRQWVRSFG